MENFVEFCPFVKKVAQIISIERTIGQTIDPFNGMTGVVYLSIENWV